jgi:hypothetical protein
MTALRPRRIPGVAMPRCFSNGLRFRLGRGEIRSPCARTPGHHRAHIHRTPDLVGHGDPSFACDSSLFLYRNLQYSLPRPAPPSWLSGLTGKDWLPGTQTNKTTGGKKEWAPEFPDAHFVNLGRTALESESSPRPSPQRCETPSLIIPTCTPGPRPPETSRCWKTTHESQSTVSHRTRRRTPAPGDGR